MFTPDTASPLQRAFTILEMMMTVAILTIIMAVIFTLTQQTAKVYKDTSGQMETFRAARNAFESMTRTLSLATLNNYYDYVDSNGVTRAQAIQAGSTKTFNPTAYGRTSDLHFVSGGGLYPKQVTHSVFFQSPLGYAASTSFDSLENLLNACGYYIEFMPDIAKPSFVASPAQHRYCLMEFIQPAESMKVYSTVDTSWFTLPLNSASPPVHMLAPNVIALLIRPRSSSADAVTPGADPISTAMTGYACDTRANLAPAIHNQLPPILEVALIAIDEASAVRLLPNTSTEPPIIQEALTKDQRFTDPDDLDIDLNDLQGDLNTSRLNYRVFRTLVPMRNSKWSSQ